MPDEQYEIEISYDVDLNDSLDQLEEVNDALDETEGSTQGVGNAAEESSGGVNTFIGGLRGGLLPALGLGLALGLVTGGLTSIFRSSAAGANTMDTLRYGFERLTDALIGPELEQFNQWLQRQIENTALWIEEIDGLPGIFRRALDPLGLLPDGFLEGLFGGGDGTSDDPTRPAGIQVVEAGGIPISPSLPVSRPGSAIDTRAVPGIPVATPRQVRPPHSDYVQPGEPFFSLRGPQGGPTSLNIDVSIGTVIDSTDVEARVERGIARALGNSTFRNGTLTQSGFPS